MRRLAGLLTILTLVSAARADEPSSLRARKRNTKPDTKAVVAGNTRFALDLYAKLRAEQGNLFCSPFSVSTALAMASGGARGETLEQMAAALHLPEQKQLHPALGALLAEVNAPGKKRGYELRTANALWGQQGHPFLDKFLNLNKRYYHAGVRQVDFRNSPDAARKTINRWVEKRTNDKIKDLLPPGTVKPLTRLVVTNAVYFKGDWASQFKKDLTRQGPFTLADGTRVNAPLMRQQARFRYHDGGTFQALEMPYAGKRLGMVVLLPKKADGLPTLEKALTAERLAGWLKSMRDAEVAVTLPRFKLTKEYLLNNTLASLGMADAFSAKKADFSGIDGSRGLFISIVAHKAFVDVNETGTEAAAATGVVGNQESDEGQVIPEFRADHPFVFLIRDRRSDSILFLGRLVDPK
jgi:serpin B